MTQINTLDSLDAFDGHVRISGRPGWTTTQVYPATGLTRSWTYFWGEAAGAVIVVAAVDAALATGTMTQRVTAT